MNTRILLIRCFACVALGVFGTLCFPAYTSATIPLLTDDTSTQGKGGVQLEIPFAYAYHRDNGITSKTTIAASILTYGVTDPIDIALTVPYQFLHIEDSNAGMDEKGLSDFFIEAKWRWYERRCLSAALKPGVTLPTGSVSKGLGSGRLTYYIVLLGTLTSVCEKPLRTLRTEKSDEIHPSITETSAPEWAIHLNTGYTRNENTIGAPEDLWFLSAAGELEILDDFRLVGDLGIMTNTEKYSYTPPSYLLVGFIYSPRDDFDIGFGAKTGLSRHETNYSIRGGVTWRF